MENYLPTLMYIISGIMLGYVAFAFYTLARQIKQQARDIENRLERKKNEK